MEQSIVSVLADLPREGLEELRASAEATQRRIAVEIEQLDAAIAQQVRREGRGAGRGRSSQTRQRVLDAVGAHPEPISPSKIIAAITAAHTEGSAPSKGAIRNMIQRLTTDGELERVSDGLYQLASASHDLAEPHTSPNGSQPSGEDREGMGLRMAAG